MKKYDLAIIGSGPAGEKAAAKAAYFGQKVVIIEKGEKVGGAGIYTGTLPSKTLKESALFFSGKHEKGLHGVEREFTRETSILDFMFRKNEVLDSESKQMEKNLLEHNVDIIYGVGQFEGPNTLRVTGEKEQIIEANKILIATGSYPWHPEHIPFDNNRVHDSDSILQLTRLPKSLCIVGAGVIGCEYATIFSTMGTKVFLVNHSDAILNFLDQEISKALVEKMKNSDIDILFNNSIKGFTVPDNENEDLHIPLENGEPLNVDMFLFAAGRQGNTSSLKCNLAGINLGQRGIIDVNEQYQSSQPHVYAVGDVIGFPALASTGMDQGRIAVSHMLNIDDHTELAHIFPYGIYTIPEVSCVGTSEEDAKKQNINYCTGKANYKDLPRGKIMGVKDGFLKIVFKKDTQVIIGVHIIGNIASELIHYGVTLIQHGNTLNDVIETVFNHPTLHELYKYACYDCLGNLSGHKIKEVH